MGSGPKEKMAPLKKARLCLLAPLFCTGLLLISTFLLLFAGSNPGLLPSAHVFTLQSHRVYLMMSCPDSALDDTFLKCDYNPGLNPIKWAALWYWAAAVALATALPFQSYLIYRPDPKWAKWALRALLPATCMLTMGFAIAMFIGNAAKANPITFIGQSPLSGGEPNSTLTGLTMAMAIITFFDCLVMWYLKKRFRKKPVMAGAPTHSLGGMSLEFPKPTTHKQDPKDHELESEPERPDNPENYSVNYAAAVQNVPTPPELGGYAPPAYPSEPTHMPSGGAAPGRPRSRPYPSDGPQRYGGYGGRGGYRQ